MSGTFWMVLGHGTPSYRHDTEESARNEAARLATVNPGETFHVLQAVAKCVKSDISWTILKRDPNTTCEIPF